MSIKLTSSTKPIKTACNSSNKISLNSVQTEINIINKHVDQQNKIACQDYIISQKNDNKTLQLDFLNNPQPENQQQINEALELIFSRLNQVMKFNNLVYEIQVQKISPQSKLIILNGFHSKIGYVQVNLFTIASEQQQLSVFDEISITNRIQQLQSKCFTQIINYQIAPPSHENSHQQIVVVQSHGQYSLEEQLKKGVSFTEYQIFHFLLSTLNCLKLLQSICIAHNNIQPSSFAYTQNSSNSSMLEWMLTGFNQALDVSQLCKKSGYDDNMDEDNLMIDFKFADALSKPPLCFTSPELIATKDYNPFKSDLYSLGLVVLAMMGMSQQAIMAFSQQNTIKPESIDNLNQILSNSIHNSNKKTESENDVNNAQQNYQTYQRVLKILQCLLEPRQEHRMGVLQLLKQQSIQQKEFESQNVTNSSIISCQREGDDENKSFNFNISENLDINKVYKQFRLISKINFSNYKQQNQIKISKTLYRMGKYRECLVQCKFNIKNQDKLLPFQFNTIKYLIIIGKIYKKTQYYEKSLKYFQKAIDQANLLIQNKNYNAIQTSKYNKALHQAQFLIGKTLMKCKNYKKAMHSFQNLLQLKEINLLHILLQVIKIQIKENAFDSAHSTCLYAKDLNISLFKHQQSKQNFNDNQINSNLFYLRNHLKIVRIHVGIFIKQLRLQDALNELDSQQKLGLEGMEEQFGIQKTNDKSQLQSYMKHACQACFFMMRAKVLKKQQNFQNAIQNSLSAIDILCGKKVDEVNNKHKNIYNTEYCYITHDCFVRDVFNCVLISFQSIIDLAKITDQNQAIVNLGHLQALIHKIKFCLAALHESHAISNYNQFKLNMIEQGFCLFESHMLYYKQQFHNSWVQLQKVKASLPTLVNCKVSNQYKKVLQLEIKLNKKMKIHNNNAIQELIQQLELQLQYFPIPEHEETIYQINMNQKEQLQIQVAKLLYKQAKSSLVNETTLQSNNDENLKINKDILAKSIKILNSTSKSQSFQQYQNAKLLGWILISQSEEIQMNQLNTVEQALQQFKFSNTILRSKIEQTQKLYEEDNKSQRLIQEVKYLMQSLKYYKKLKTFDKILFDLYAKQSSKMLIKIKELMPQIIGIQNQKKFHQFSEVQAEQCLFLFIQQQQQQQQNKKIAINHNHDVRMEQFMKITNMRLFQNFIRNKFCNTAIYDHYMQSMLMYMIYQINFNEIIDNI